MSRRLVIVLGVIAFLAISVAVARWLTTEGREREAVLTVLRDEARGDTAAVLARMPGCAADPACRSQATRATLAVKRPGDVKILSITSPTAYSLGAATGRTRVAWTVIDQGLPVVQCVTVERTGNALVNRDIIIRGISLPITNDGSC